MFIRRFTPFLLLLPLLACMPDTGTLSSDSDGDAASGTGGRPSFVRSLPAADSAADAAAFDTADASDVDNAGGSGGTSTGGIGGGAGAGGSAGSGPVCVPTAEVCNGKDDDCDGVIDNGLSCRPLGAACTSAAQCTSGFCVGDPGRCCDTACAGAQFGCAGCTTGYCEDIREGQVCFNKPTFCEDNVGVTHFCRTGECVARRTDCSKPFCVGGAGYALYGWCDASAVVAVCSPSRYSSSDGLEYAPTVRCMPPVTVCIEGRCQ